MSCNCTPNQQCPCNFELRLDGTTIAPYIGGEPLKPLDLADALVSAGASTELTLDTDGKLLVYSKGDDDSDNISIQSIAALISLDDLLDVEIDSINNGELLAYDSSAAAWKSYTIPNDTIVSSIGINADGEIVKALASDPLPGSVEIPLGGSMIWTGDEADLPSNFFPMDGRAISRATYSDYFDLVGTRYGVGNNTTTFNIPNLKGRSPMGYDAAQTEFNVIGKTGGEKNHTLSYDEMPVHSHGVNDPGHSHGLTRDVAQTYGGTQRLVIGGSGQAFNFGGSPIAGSGTGIFLSNAGGGAAHNNLGPYLAMPFAVRVQ